VALALISHHEGDTMADATQPSPLRQQIGDFAPKIVDLTDDVLFGDVWERPELVKRDRSLITIAMLVTGGNWPQLEAHIRIGQTNGLSEPEIIEAFTHLAFYAGWPKALSAIDVARKVFSQ
jgi:4-carboxymuconolactone decarboxylase